MQKAFTFRENDAKGAPQYVATVTLPDRVTDLPETVQAALYSAAIANEVISVQGGMRRWIAKNRTATPAQIDAEAQARFDARFKGVRRATTTVVVEKVVVVKQRYDATAMQFTKGQLAHFAADPNVELFNVPEGMRKYLPEGYPILDK